MYPANCPEPYASATVGAITIDLWDRARLMDRVDASVARVDLPLVIASVNLDHIARFGPRGPATLPSGRDGTGQWTSVLDGRPVVRALARRPAAWRGGRKPTALPGSELLAPILALAATRGARVGLIGGSALSRARWPAMMAAKFPGLTAAGTREVRWDWLDQPQAPGRLADEVASWRADVLVVSLGKPRQELWLRDHLATTGAAVALPFGSAAEYLTETAKRPPEWARRHGVEWAVRLVAEPRRLGRRYLLEAPPALLMLRRELAVIAISPAD